MMNAFRRTLAGISPRSMAVLLSLALIAVHAILLLGALLRWNAASQLVQQIENINENIDELDAAEAQELRDLEDELAAAQSRVDDLEEALPEPTEPFPLYAQARELADQQEAVLLVIERTGSDRTRTVAGEVASLQYGVDLQADLTACLRYITRLERRGGAELRVLNTHAQPEAEMCTFQVLTVALTE